MTDPIEILRELLEAFTAKYPPAEAGQEAQTAWAMRQSTAEKAARSLLASPPAPAAQPDLAQKPTVTHLLRLAVAMRHAPSDGYDDAYKCIQNALYAALSVRPSNDIADDIPGSTAAGDVDTTAALTDDALLRFAIVRYRGEFNEAVMIDFMRELLRHVAGVLPSGETSAGDVTG